ncbi:MAG: transposase [Ignavibacteria bacterium]|nr:transposase [Ignavibacteria bacterium]
MIKNFFFFTATVLNWKHFLNPDKYKDIIIESFKFLVNKNRVRIFAFVIMPNHYHTVWRINENLEKSDFQRDSMKFTGQTILRDLKSYHKEIHNSMYVGAKDRKYQFWERNPLSVPLYSQKVVEQKINYIHGNPIKPKWNLAAEPQDYKYSSAGFYYTGKDEFGFLENYLEVLNER